MWMRTAGYGAALAAAALALQVFDYLHLTQARPDDLALGMLATGFLGLGALLGAHARRPRRTPAAPGAEADPEARSRLGISARELEVLAELAAGRSNKQIAARLDISPNTVKTHVARLYEKLGAQRRTEAVHRARAFGLVP